LDTGPQRITDEAERAQVWRQARVVHAKTLATALLLTALALLP
jgi:hypothetical protein